MNDRRLWAAIVAAAVLAGRPTTPEGLRKVAGVSRQAMKRVEAGEEPTRDVLERIAAAVGSTRDDLRRASLSMGEPGALLPPRGSRLSAGSDGA